MDIYLILSLITMPIAVWRISNMLADVRQEGLFHSLDWIREKAGVKFNTFNEPEVKYGSVASGLLCVWCNSIWFGILGTIVLLINHSLAFYCSFPFALSAVAIAIETWKNHDEVRTRKEDLDDKA